MFPAPAGINRHCSGVMFSPGGVPRASGDKPCFADVISLITWCSPRQRG